MAAVPAVAPITWAASNEGWPIYAARNPATGLQERLQENAAAEVVDAAGVVYAVNADGYPQDAAGVLIPQASQAIRIRDLAMGTCICFPTCLLSLSHLLFRLHHLFCLLCLLFLVLL